MAEENTFDNVINTDFHNSNYQTQLDLTRTITGGAVATVTDAAASIWNSLPITPEVETRDLLGRISNDALQVYNENPEAIETASFVAGSLLPIGIATKSMGAARAGVKGMNWFSKAGKEADLSVINTLFSEGKAATSEYKSLLRQTYAKGAVNQAIDALAAEVAIVGMMNAHPLMEDYLEDPVKNFAISAAFGGVIGGAIGHIGDRYAVRSLTGATEAKAIQETLGQLRDIAPDMTSAVKLQSYALNVKNLDNMLEMGKVEGKLPTNNLAMSFAEKMKETQSAMQATLFDDIASPMIKNLPKEERDFFMRAVVEMPEMFGVEKVSLFTEKQATGKAGLKGPKEVLTAKPELAKIEGATVGGWPSIAPMEFNNLKNKLTNEWLSAHPNSEIYKAYDTALDAASLPNDWIEALKVAQKEKNVELENFVGYKLERFLEDTQKNSPSDAVKLEAKLSAFRPKGTPGVLKEVKSVYYPEHKLFGLESDVTNYGNAASLGKTLPDLEKTYAGAYNFGKVPNLDSALELAGKSSAEIDGLFAAYKSRVSKMDETALKNLTIGQDDLPLLSAVITKIKEDPAMVMKLQMKVSDRSPVFEAILKSNAGKTGAGMPQDYAQEVGKFTAPGKINQYKPGALSTLDGDAEKFISAWLAGDQKYLNRAALSWSAKGFSAASPDPQMVTGKRIFDAIYNSQESTALRDQFRRVADINGDVYLYRGSRASKITQQNILESYSTDPKKAAEFGTVRMYKVHVDNIAAGWDDLKSSDGLRKNEILVLSGARPEEAVLDANLKPVFKNQQQQGAIVVSDKNSKSVYVSDLEDLLVSGKEQQIDSLLSQGIPMQSIALKTNTPVNIVEAYAFAKPSGTGLRELVQDVNELITTKTLAVAEERTKIQNAPLRLEGNIKKNPYTEAHASLNNKQMKDMSDTIMMASMYSSQSGAVREMADFFYKEMKQPLDILKTELARVNNEYAGNKFLNSTDFWARNMGSVGPIASAIGKQVERIGNDLKKRVITPISDAMATVAKDAPSTIEFNTFVNLNASLKGWRQFTPDGTLVQRVEKMGIDGKIAVVLEPVQFEGKVYRVTQESVKKLINGMQEQSTELLNLANAGKKIKGQADVTDLGLWIPSFNPVNKFIAYVHNAGDDTTKMIWANGKEQFEDAVQSYKKYIQENGMGDKVRVVTKAEQADWNILNGRLDPITMEVANIGMQKTGAATQAINRSTLDVFSEIAGGYEHSITSHVRNLAELNLHEVTGMLDNMSVINQASVKSQPLGEIKKIINQPKDAAATLKNTLLGNSNIGEYAGWQKINQSFETGLTMGLNAVTSIWDGTIGSLTKRVFGKNSDLTPEIMRKVDYEQMAAELKTRGIVNPWASFDDEAAKMYGLSKLEDHKDSSKRIIYASNALAATVALRIGELAQPIVNILSLPILTGLATASKMPAEFMGVVRGTMKDVGGVQIMYEGARAANSPLWKKFDDLWTKQGHYTSLVSEASNVLRASRSFEKGAISKVENALDSRMVEIMSKPADWSESFVRRQTMFTGAVLAKRLYPELSDEGITIFARDFMDKAVGNFHAAQRPVFFQGTLGVALGLFQTYSLTLGQSIYRQLEMKNYKALGKAALTQSGIFGVGSMPGFKQISETIGDHFSDENVDLTTGTYRAIGDKAADMLLYGLPSNLGPSFYSRGDVSIRPPNVLAGLQNTVAVSFVSQTLDMFGQLKNAMASDNPDMARALGESLSMQSMSRPLARGSELLTGYSVTRKGNTVQTPEEVWTATGIMARVLGTRPLEEGKLREAMHLNTFYGSKDREARNAVTMKLKTAIRGGELTQEQIDGFAEQYMRKGGTPTGWQSALNTAVAQTDIKGDITLVDKMKPNNPLNYMISNLD